MEKLSIIMPVYNEIKTIKEIVDKVWEVSIPVERELIIIESNSTDGTREYIKDNLEGKENIKVIYESAPRGKGHAVRTGIKAATGDIILIQDAHLEYKPSEYPELLEPILSGKAKFVLGSRHLGSGTWKIRKFDEKAWNSSLINFVSVFYYALFWILYGTRLTDPQTMFKVFRRECLEGIKLKSNYFQLDWEIVIKLIKKNHIPLEVPVSYKARTFEEGKKIRLWRDGSLALWAILKYRFVD